MNRVYGNEKALMKTGCFKSRLELVYYLLMKCIGEGEGPAGSWSLKASLSRYGLEYSTATVGRYLKELDDKEYTVQKGNQGRVLTPAGSAWLGGMEEMLDRARMRNQMAQAMQVTEYDELIDLLNVRRILETEAARLAALNAGKEDLALLEQSVKIHREYVMENQDPTDPALDFHAVIAQISHNKFILALLNMLIFEEKKIEAVFETLVTRERGKIYVKEHEDIARAIQKKDAKKAAELMQTHIEELCAAIEEQSEEYGGRL